MSDAAGRAREEALPATASALRAQLEEMTQAAAKDKERVAALEDQVTVHRVELESARSCITAQEAQLAALRAELAAARAAAAASDAGREWEEEERLRLRRALCIPEAAVVVSDGEPLGRGAYGVVCKATLHGENVCAKVRSALLTFLSECICLVRVLICVCVCCACACVFVCVSLCQYFCLL